MRQKRGRVVKQVGDCHAEGGEVGEEWHFMSFAVVGHRNRSVRDIYLGGAI